MSLARRIKVARVGADLDQVTLAERVGVSRQTISHWERGGAEPGLTAAVRLALATGVSLDWLAEGVETEMAPAANDGSQAVRPKGFEPLTFWSVVEPALVAVPDFVPAWMVEAVAL